MLRNLLLVAEGDLSKLLTTQQLVRQLFISLRTGRPSSLHTLIHHALYSQKAKANTILTLTLHRPHATWFSTGSPAQFYPCTPLLGSAVLFDRPAAGFYPGRDGTGRPGHRHPPTPTPPRSRFCRPPRAAPGLCPPSPGYRRGGLGRCSLKTRATGRENTGPLRLKREDAVFLTSCTTAVRRGRSQARTPRAA